MEVELPRTAAAVHDAFANHMAELCPPGVSYSSQELTVKQPWEADGFRVQRVLTVPFVMGLVKPREYVDLLWDSPVGPDGTLRRNAYGLGLDEWPDTDGTTRGVNFQVALVAGPASSGEGGGGGVDAGAGERTAITYLVQTASNGWVPGWAVDSALVDEHFKPILDGFYRFLEIPVDDGDSPSEADSQKA
jgi:hypothetical protein